jgi:hypothetical protein
MGTQGARGGEVVEPHKGDSLAPEITVTSLETLRIAHWRRVSWDKVSGIEETNRLSSTDFLDEPIYICHI